MNKNYPTLKNLVPLFFLLFSVAAFSQNPTIYTTPGTFTFTVPVGVTTIKVEAWGGGAAGKSASGGGGGGGAFAGINAITVVPLTTYTITVGQGGAATGGNGQASSFGTLVVAAGAIGTNGGTVAASTGTIRYAGGNGGTSSGNAGAGGGGSAGAGGAGGVGGNTSDNNGGKAGGAGFSGFGTAGASGGVGGNNNSAGFSGTFPGGGGGEGGTGRTNGRGGNGQVIISWITVSAASNPTTVCFGANVNLTASATPLDPRGVLLAEGFNDTTNNWTTSNPSTGGTLGNAAWTLRPNNHTIIINKNPAWNYLFRFNSNDASQFYLSDSDSQGPGGTTQTILTSPVISTLGYSSLSLEFYHYYQEYTGSIAKVEVTTNNGMTWTTIQSYTTTQGSFSAFANTTINLGAYLGVPSLQIRFNYQASYGYWWAIDNVTVSGTRTSYDYSWTASPSGTSGLPAGAGTPSTTNTGITANPTATTIYTVTASASTGDGLIGQSSKTVTVNAASTIVLTSGTQSPTVCSGTAITNTVYTFGGSATSASVTGLPAGLTSVVSGSTITISGTPTASGTYTITTTGNTAPCTSATVSGTVTRNAASTIVLTSGTQNPTVCSGTAITNTVYTFGGSATSASVSGLPTGLTSVVSGSTITISGIPTASGTYTITTTGHTAPCTAATISGAVTVNTTAAPTIGAISPLTCAIPAGSVVLSGLTISGTLKQTGFITKSYPITATTMTIYGLAVGDYYFAVNNGTCESVISSVVTIVDKSSTTWNGSGWSNGEPSINSRIIFAGNYNSTKDVIGCDCTVNSGANVVFKYINPTLGHTLTVTNDVKVLGSGKLTFENNASLVQTANSTTNTNSGKITYQRQTSPYKPFDYIYWSSPVVGQILRDVSPLTPLDKFYSFDVATYDWKQENANLPMTNGVGYIIRGAAYVLPAPPGLHQASFFGIPNNGLITVPIPSTAVNSESSALLGNPYPSALDANEFLKGNTSILEGTLYFWTHNTAIQNVGNITNGSQGSGALAYTSDDYATYNLTGGVTVVSTGNIVAGIAQTGNKPSGKIASGQSFFVGINSVAGTVKFENSMRVGVGSLTGDNTQFFRTASGKSDVTTAHENHRVWLNLTNTQGAFKQLLVGYITGATNADDPFFDGVSFNGNEFIDFYSITDDETLTIQGRALPFEENDVVALGYSSAIEGSFTISIDEVDGLFTSQNIYLEDKLNSSIHDLNKSGYTFRTSIGTFDDRFVLRYTDKTLGTGDFDTTNVQVLVSVKNKQIKINSSVESIDKVLIYDMLGKQIFRKINVGTNELVIPNLGSSEQVLIVKTLLQNGQTVTTKLIY